jgi:hypothetical protein
MSRRITTDELWTMLRFGSSSFFSVEFERRTSRSDGTNPAGTLRKMLCRTGMNKYKLGVIPDVQRDTEDFRHGILTVWSFDSYLGNLRRGMSKLDAGLNAWRRVDLITLRSCSLLSKIDLEAMGINETLLPPDVIAGVHHLTNQYRLSHLPREPIAV